MSDLFLPDSVSSGYQLADLSKLDRLYSRLFQLPRDRSIRASSAHRILPLLLFSIVLLSHGPIHIRKPLVHVGTVVFLGHTHPSPHLVALELLKIPLLALECTLACLPDVGLGLDFLYDLGVGLDVRSLVEPDVFAEDLDFYFLARVLVAFEDVETVEIAFGQARDYGAPDAGIGMGQDGWVVGVPDAVAAVGLEESWADGQERFLPWFWVVGAVDDAVQDTWGHEGSIKEGCVVAHGGYRRGVDGVKTTLHKGKKGTRGWERRWDGMGMRL